MLFRNSFHKLKMSSKTKVCVIGAGAAGLCAAKHLSLNGRFEPTVYEQTKEASC